MSKVIAILSVFLYLLGVGAHRLGAEVDFQVSYEYFPVRYAKGMSVPEMIVKDTPLRDANGANRHVGQAVWNIKYSNVKVTQPLVDVCLIGNPGVSCTCVIKLPRLEGGDAATRAVFETYVTNTRQHEMTHCQIALTHARLLEERFMQFGKRPCQKLSGDMRDQFDEILADCRREQKQFDNNAYGYNQYLRLERLQSMVDSGANVLPPEEGYKIPILDMKDRGLKVLDQDKEKLSGEGFYKDESGVWKNY